MGSGLILGRLETTNSLNETPRTATAMKDLRVLFAPAADQGYVVHLEDADGTRLGVEVPFKPFLADDDYEDLRWYLEEFMELPDGGAVIRAQRIEKNLDDWGRKLYGALFTAEE